MKQFAIVLEKCFSKCLDGASNADRGNPVYSQDKSAPAWPIHTHPSTAPMPHTYKIQNLSQKIQNAKEYLASCSIHFNHPLLWVSQSILASSSWFIITDYPSFMFLCFSKCFCVFTPNASSPLHLSAIFQFLWVPRLSDKAFVTAALQ